MKKIQYNIYERDTKDASGKAKTDVTKILLEHGFQKLYQPSKYRLLRIIQQFLAILFLPKDTFLFVQYKANISFFYRMLQHKKNIKKLAIIHDLESLRGLIPVKEEIDILNGFQTIISHNPHMTKWLKSKGLGSEIVDLNIFDYLLDDSVICNQNYDKNIVFFAGNLIKSKFLMDISSIPQIQFNIYGGKFDGIKKMISQRNVSYKGAFSPSQLIANVEGGWGLVWDGDSLEICTGVAGEYMKYNNPHKVSMCIVSERPVIIWSQSAMADYILSHKLGIVIDSLLELPEIIKQVSDDEYAEFLSSIRLEKENLVSGRKLGGILSDIESIL